jgi:branched-chain amino acid transport system ATP-binding protein
VRADTVDPRPALVVRDLSVSYEAIRFSAERKGVLGLFGLRRKRYPVLTSISFEIPFDHRLTAIVGPNGAGKTSLLRAINGDIPTQGEITWAGRTINRLSQHERTLVGITCVLHENGVFPNLTVQEHITLIESKHGTGRKPIDELIERLRLRDARLAKSVAFLQSSTKAANLSGGERKMLSFLRLIFRPWSLVLLDEPTSGLSAQWLEVYAVLLEMLYPACVLQAEQYSRAKLACGFGAALYELKEGGLCRMSHQSDTP